MDRLPSELLRIIFENLDLNTLRQVRNVSKQFRSVCAIVRVKEVIINDVADEFKSIWFYTNDTIDYRNAIKFSTFLFNFNNVQTDLFALRRHLKRLHFGFWNENLNFNFGFLDSFTELEQLDIQCSIKGGYPHRIRAPKLRILSVDYFDEKECPALFVECPKLERLKIDSRMELVHIEYKKNVRHLEVPFYRDDLEQFKWIECLQVNYTAQGIGANRNLLSVFESLRELRLHLYYSLSPGECQELSNAVQSIFKQKSNLVTDLKVYLTGVQFDHVDKFDEFSSLLKKMTFRGDQEHAKTLFQFQNFDNLSCPDLTFFSEANYSSLLKASGQRLPADFFSKFFNIRYVKVTSKIAKPDQFAKFLKKCQYLKALDLKNAALSQQHLNQLPDVCQISYFYLEEEHSNAVTSHDFALRFKLLIRFVTNQNTDGLVDLALRSFAELKYLRLFRFRRGQDEFSITAQDGNKYSMIFRGIYSNGRTDFHKDDLHFSSLITYCDLLKSNEWLLWFGKLFAFLIIVTWVCLGIAIWVYLRYF